MSQSVLELLIRLKDEATEGLKGLSGTLSTLGGVAGGVALGGVVALGAGIASGLGDAREAAGIMAQTEAVIRSTGGAAGVTAGEVADMAGSLSAAAGMSLFGDSDIQKGQNLLLTFTNIKDTLPDATSVMVDMAQALGTDVSSGAIQLGKALNDPINGISALSRVGVTFTDAQKEQIKTMADAGDIAGAQRIILAELNREFGGSAKAAADADGGMAQFNDRMGEAAETVGAALLPMVNNLLGALNTQLLPALEANIGPAIAAISPVLDGVAVAMGALVGAIGQFAGFVQANLTPILAGLSAGLIALAPVIYGMVIPPFLAWATAAIASATATAAALAPVVIPVLAIGAAVALLVAAWQNDWGGIRTTLTTFWETTAAPIFEQLKTWLETTLTNAGAALSSFWTGTLQPALAAVGDWVETTGVPLFEDFKRGLDAVIKVGGDLAAMLSGALTGAINGAQGVITGVSGWFSSIAEAIKRVIDWVQRFIDKLASVKVPEWLQGHSPPPMADWFSYIADAAGQAREGIGAFTDGARGIALPDLAGGGAPLGGRAAPGGVGGGGGGVQRVQIELLPGPLSQMVRTTVREREQQLVSLSSLRRT